MYNAHVKFLFSLKTAGFVLNKKLVVSGNNDCIICREEKFSIVLSTADK